MTVTKGMCQEQKMSPEPIGTKPRQRDMSSDNTNSLHLQIATNGRRMGSPTGVGTSNSSAVSTQCKSFPHSWGSDLGMSASPQSSSVWGDGTLSSIPDVWKQVNWSTDPYHTVPQYTSRPSSRPSSSPTPRSPPSPPSHTSPSQSMNRLSSLPEHYPTQCLSSNVYHTAPPIYAQRSQTHAYGGAMAAMSGYGAQQQQQGSPWQKQSVGRFSIHPTEPISQQLTAPSASKKEKQRLNRSIEQIASALANIPPPTIAEESDSDGETTHGTKGHPNKFPVEIEYHNNKHCSYKRQNTRSGYKVHLEPSMVEGADTPRLTDPQQIKYYQKDIVRVCSCGNYVNQEKYLLDGLPCEQDGYEVHYNQKCKWKAYDDFKTGKRVLIRLCKCYSNMYAA